jgi:hypothetical protein
VNWNVPVSFTTASNWKYGLVEIAGSSVTSITFSPLKSQVKRLMIDRGMMLPSPSGAGRFPSGG